MNKDVFNSLQPQDQQALVDIMNTASGARAVEWDKLNDTATAAWLKLPGRAYNKPSAADIAAMQAGMIAPINAWVQKATATGAPGAELLQYLKDRITFWGTQKLPVAPWVAK
jgi:TRAP-type C4-dicarboxylate transport system substrate-binding protein